MFYFNQKAMDSVQIIAFYKEASTFNTWFSFYPASACLSILKMGRSCQSQSGDKIRILHCATPLAWNIFFEVKTYVLIFVPRSENS